MEELVEEATRRWGLLWQPIEGGCWEAVQKLLEAGPGDPREIYPLGVRQVKRALAARAGRAVGTDHWSRQEL
eukprot:11265732-Alexandrium_andersonii.AAC.1